jgi:hypothetical protein
VQNTADTSRSRVVVTCWTAIQFVLALEIVLWFTGEMKLGLHRPMSCLFVPFCVLVYLHP